MSGAGLDLYAGWVWTNQHTLQQVTTHLRIILTKHKKLLQNTNGSSVGKCPKHNVIQQLAGKEQQRVEPADSSVVCMTFLGLTGIPARNIRKLTSLPGPELRRVRAREDADADTDLLLKCHRASNKVVLVHFVVHLRHCLQHGPAMFSSSSVHGDHLCIWAEPENGNQA